MKKIIGQSLITAIILITIVSSTTFAQENEVVIRTVEPEKKSRSLSFGLYGGSNVAWIGCDTKGYNTDGVRYGLNYGLITDFSLANNDNYFISTGVVISNIGGKMNNPSAFNDTSGNPIPARVQVEYSIRMLEVPFSLKMKTNEIGYIKYFGQFGVSPGIALRHAQKGDKIFATGTEQLEEGNAVDHLLNFRFGVVAGAGIEYNLTGNTNLMVGVTYSGAFTNILKGQTVVSSGERRAFEVDDNGLTDVSKVQGESPFLVTSGRELISRADFVSLNVAIFF